MLAAEVPHRDEAIIKQVVADLKACPWRTPLGDFCARGAWTVLDGME